MQDAYTNMTGTSLHPSEVQDLVLYICNFVQKVRRCIERSISIAVGCCPCESGVNYSYFIKSRLANINEMNLQETYLSGLTEKVADIFNSLYCF